MTGKRFVGYACAALVGAAPVLVLADDILPNCAGPTCTFANFIQLLQNIITFLLFKISMPVFAVIIAWAGFTMLTANGNPGKIGKAKGMLMTAVIGFALALGAYLIVNFLTTFFLKGSPNASDVLRGSIQPSYEII